MASASGQPRTEGSLDFDPDRVFEDWAAGLKIIPENNNLRSSIIALFKLPQDDQYVYHAIAKVNLAQVQTAIDHGGEAGLHAWYFDDEGKPLSPPSQADIKAYTSVFAPNTSPSKVLTGFAANAKKASLRSSIATYLKSQRTQTSDLTIPKSKKHVNPYYDFWAWSCSTLEWAGPEAGTEKLQTSHHILPVFMHHFGCVVPSYESLEVVKQLARSDKSKTQEGRRVLEIGSGNGYWTYMLRRLGVEVTAVDNEQSSWRTMWIGNTIIVEGENYLKDNNGCKDAVLLLVYPIVGADFTVRMLYAYKGRTIVVAGTQNRNGYTSFQGKTIGDYMSAERKDFDKTLQIPLPSFAGKDEALYVFERQKQ